ncbi:MAG TPA: S8 family peptidase [Flavobacteriaceae bacterium]|nr:S8 family peptidase [Flavobacteriaceae bacterium]
MKIPYFKSILAASGAAILLAGCGTSNLVVNSEPIRVTKPLPIKKSELTEAQLKTWKSLDPVNDTIPGMSVNKAYSEIIKDQEGKTVIVAVLDSGVDIEHEDLDSKIWVNEDEIPNNGIDDDKNGYIDDIHGWNFLGDMVGANLELTRILKKLKPKYDGKSANEISPENKDEFALYQRANKEYTEKHTEAQQNKAYYENILSSVKGAQEALEAKLGKGFTAEELSNMEANTAELQQQKGMVMQMMARAGDDFSFEDLYEQLEGGIEYFTNQLQYHYNLEFNGREVVGDDPNVWNDMQYGNNDVDGPTEDEEDVKHGTHVAGIIAAERNNGIGINGVAENVKIMVLRAVPDGDEFDKDIARGIRYAVDNGATIINGSFGKYYSQHSDWVNDAIKYAADHDVLIVRAAGNDALDLETNRVYPNDQWPEQPEEIANNFLVVGALNYLFGENLLAGFSNYGLTNVDVFAPGVKIYSSTPLNTYEYLQGTSMASPAVAGVAAVIRSYYPKLSAEQVKSIIEQSGIPMTAEVLVPTPRDQRTENKNINTLDKISVSGKIVNLYNALILADTIAK